MCAPSLARLLLKSIALALTVCMLALGGGGDRACAATVLSELSDPVGDGGLNNWLDIRSARVVQVDTNVLQFDMTLAATPPRDANPDHFITYIWFVDSDENGSTGQPYSGGVGSDYNLRATLREHWIHGQAYIDAIPPVGVATLLGMLGVQHLDERTATVRILVDTRQIGSPARFRWTCAAFSHDSSGDYINASAEAVPNLTPPPPGTPARVLVEPAMALREGTITRSLRVRVIDSQGNRLSNEGRDITLYAYQNAVDCRGEFITAHPQTVTRTHVSACADGVVSGNATEVMVGSLLMRPAVILLDTMTHSTGHVALEGRAADGSLVTQVGHEVFLANDDESVAAFDPGPQTLTAQPTGEGRQTCIRAWWDEAPANNWSVVRVVKGGVIGPQPLSYPGRNCCYWLPGPLGFDLSSGLTLDEMMERWQVVGSMDVAMALMIRELGTVPFLGDTQDLAGIENDDVFTVCGGSGNPIGLGYDPTRPVSCIQIEGNGAPHFGVMAHEVGHNVVGACPPLSAMLFPSGLPHSFSYSEGIATLLSMIVQAAFLEGPLHYGLDADMVAAAGDPRVYASLPHCRQGFQAALEAYTAAGSNYVDLTPDVLDGIFVRLADIYGWGFYQRFFAAFWPPTPSFPLQVTTDEQQAAVFAAALSTAVGEDLRDMLRSQWGFPIDDACYDLVRPWLEQRRRWRGDDHDWLFDDVPPTYWAFPHIAAVADATIAGGYSASPPTYRPAEAVTRSQMAVFISRALASGDSLVPTGPPVGTFSDVPTDYWAFKYVEYAVDNGVTGGYSDGTYRPTVTVTRDQMAVFMARAMVGGDTHVPTGPSTAYFPDVPTDYWAFKYVEYIKSQSVTGGYPDGTYRPLVAVTRDQMAVYVQRAFDLPM